MKKSTVGFVLSLIIMLVSFVVFIFSYFLMKASVYIERTGDGGLNVTTSNSGIHIFPIILLSILVSSFICVIIFAIKQSSTKVCPACHAEISIHAHTCPKCNANLVAAQDSLNPGERREWLITLLLCAFMGGIGGHRFYTGHVGIGIVQLFTLGGFGIWALIDLIRILTGSFTDVNGNKLLKQWGTF